MRCAALRLSPTRALTPASLLKTVRSDPGMTAEYYANRYFGKSEAMAVNHLLWTQLKRHGKVTLDRSDGSDYPPRWHAAFESPKMHTVRRHNPEEEDLSVLREASVGSATAPTAPQAPPSPSSSPDTAVGAAGEDTSSIRLESLVLHLVQQEPRREIQYYIGQLPLSMRSGAPLAFKRLRESGLLTREAGAKGTFVWH